MTVVLQRIQPFKKGLFGFLLTFALLASFSEPVSAQVMITTASLPEGRVGATYTAQLIATGGLAPYTWSVVSGTLPAGLTLTTEGVISGTPTISGKFDFLIRVTDSSPMPQMDEETFSITIPLEITTTSLPGGLINTAYSQTLTATPTIGPPVTWGPISGGALPAGVTLSSDGVISGTPTESGTFNFTVPAMDSSSPPLTASKALTLTIQPVLTITTPSPLPLAVAGVFYSQTLQASGPSPVTWSIVSGTAPPGLTLSSNGTLSGTPTVAGTFDFTVQAASSNPPQTATKALRIVVNPALAITTSATLPPGAPGVPYSATLAATGGVPPYTWTSTSPLPPGLGLSSAGVISGTPASTGNFSFTAQVSDNFTPAQTASRTFTIAVSNVLAISTTALPNGAVNVPYSRTLAATAGTPPYTWSLEAGTLPTGLSLSGEGVISGTPTAAGTFDFTVRVVDNSASPQTASKALQITIQPPLAITTSGTLPLAVVGAFYAQLLTSTGPSPVTWSIVSGIAPPGLTLTSSGTLSSTPTVAGTYDFTVQASGGDPVQTVTRALRLVVNLALTILTPATLPDALLGTAYSVSIEARGGVAPYTWSNPGRGVPPGLSFSSSGVLTGTPTGTGNFSFTLQVSDSFNPTQEASRTFTLTVSSTLVITTTSLPNAIQDSAYSKQLEAAGAGPFTWVRTAGTLPAGLTLSAPGLLQGTPTEIGSRTFTVTATDSRGAMATREYTLTVDPPVPSLSAPDIPATLNPTQAADVSLVLSAPHPSPLSGRLTLSFSSTAEVPIDDPMTRFSTGSRTTTFTIPANSTNASFPTDVMLLTGTVAGTVRLTANFENGPSDVPVATATIPATGPQMTEVTAVGTAAGLDVQIIGYSPSRRVLSAEFSFDIRTENGTQRVTLSKNVDPEFSVWYTNAASTPFGSSFSFLQSFTIQGGDASAIEGVTVRLTNAQGSNVSSTVRPR